MMAEIVADTIEVLSKKQRAVLNYILKYREKHGYPPAIRDIGKGIGLSSSASVFSHLKTLEKKGIIKRDPTRPRAIDILIKEEKQKPQAQPDVEEQIEDQIEEQAEEQYEDAEGISIYEYPLLKGYTPGVAVFDQENYEKVIYMSSEISGGEEGFLVKMSDAGLEGAGIIEGDLLLMSQVDTASDGDIIAAVADDKLWVRRYFRFSNVYRLQPDNRKMSAVFSKNVTIIGKLKGLIRSYA